MPTSTPIFHRNAPPAICHIILPRSSSSIHTNCLLFTSHKHLGQAKHAIISPAFCLRFHLSTAPLSRSRYSSISTAFCSQRQSKKLAIKITSSPPPSFFANRHAPTLPFAFAYLCIYYPWRYLSRTKKKDLLGKGRRQSPPKKPFVVSKYFIVVPVQEQFIKFVKNDFFWLQKSLQGYPLFLPFTSHPLFVIHISTPQMTADAPQ